MLRHSGRAAREVGQTLHHVCHFLLTATVLISIGLIGAAWRLSRGPVDLGFFKGRIEDAVNGSIGTARVTIGTASIEWGGFSKGLDQPLALRVTDLTVEEAAGTGRVRVPVVEATLSARWLLIGRVLPRTITLQGARLVLTRDANGAVNFDIGGGDDPPGPSPLPGLLAVLGAPSETDMQAGGGRFSQLSAVSIHDARMRLEDRLLGLNWLAERADVDLSRRRGGGVDGQMTLAMALGGQKARLAGSFTLAPSGRSAHARVRLSQVTPAALADTAPVLAPLAALDVPMTLDAEADLGPELTLTHLRLAATAGAGKVHTDSGSIPVHRARFVVAGTPDEATLESGIVELQPAPNAPVSTLGASGQLTHRAGRLTAALHLTLDHVAFADLPALWPADISPPTHAWITQNITGGRARDGKADLVLQTPDNVADVDVVSATATLEGDDVAVTWLPTVPRAEQAKAHVVLTDPDKVEIDVTSARQTVNGGDPLAIQNGHVTIVGLSKKDQIATIRCDATGSIASAITLLKEPRLRILDRHPMDLRAPSGDARIGLRVAVPLLLNLGIDDVTIHATGNLTKLHLTGIAAGRDMDDGALSLDVDTNHLAIKGTTRLAGIPSNLDVMMDFRAGPPSQVTQRVSVTGKATGQALADAGLDTGGVVTGEIGLGLILSEYRNGDGDLSADADLTSAGLTISPLGWKKAAGNAAKASARVTLSKNRLTGIDRIAMDGPGIQVRGAVTASDGRLDTVRLDHVVLGRTDIKGVVRLLPGGSIGMDLTGAALDISAKLLEKSPKRDPAAPEPPPGQPWSVRARFDRVFLAHDQTATQIAVTGENDGRITRALSISGKTGSGKALSIRIEPGPVANGQTVRHLAIDVQDAGEILQGVGLTEAIKGGVMTVTGDFDDTTRDHTLSGTLELSDFRASRAPVLGKLLQAVTLYGLVDALGGPGLSFSGMTVPFKFDDNAISLQDARAFSPSLGLTAKGRIDRIADRMDLEGTLVPAYVFNSMLGRIPLIGGLFRAEKGGGLFAMNYSLRGPIDDPTVSANPFSALTPGILRGMFGLFDRPPPGQPPPDRQPGPGGAQKP